jgi:uncharacterized protein (UPF0332 family)
VSDEPLADFGWLDFLTLARDLAGRDDEAAHRSAVSRSYYAVFHSARSVLERHDPAYAEMRSQDSHKQVWDRLNALGRRQTKTAVRTARSLLHARRAADYRLDADNWPRRAQDAIVDAERALNALSDLLESN